MEFLKKNIVYFVLLLALLAFMLIKPLRDFVSEQIAMSPTVAKINSETMISQEVLDIELKGINTRSTNLKNLRGKVLFLNFWGTWCPPCRAEWPTIQKLYDLKKDKVQFVLIAMQDKENDVKKFLKDNKYTVPVYIAESSLDPKILPAAFPTTYLLGKDGRILKKEDSSMDWSKDSVLEFIDNVTK
ncbi:MAG: TlpA family protein disulfide reductase [Weeksellaceae bacterium]|nr:TlpA family protein disulfide reductase [Weeksellaceae bacterium]